MSEMKIIQSSAIHNCTRNYRLRSWIYAIIGVYMVIAGYAVYLEVRPYMAIIAILLGTAAVRNANHASTNAARYVGWTAIVLAIMEWITCFM